MVLTSLGLLCVFVSATAQYIRRAITDKEVQSYPKAAAGKAVFLYHILSIYIVRTQLQVKNKFATDST